MKRSFAIAVCVALLPIAPASPCASVSHRATSIPVANEEAIISYDSRTGTERFIRKATFDTAERDFGFLVPTPSAPTLTEASNVLFDRLHTVIQTPIVQKKTRFLWGQMKSESVATSAKLSAASQVVVQERKRVGDFDAAVLKATNTDALLQWLKKHNYVSRPDLKEWLQPYVRMGYTITAFRVADGVLDNPSPDGNIPVRVPNEAELRKWSQNVLRDRERLYAQDAVQPTVRLSPVCLTFQTPAPFYPYRETRNARARKGRLLRVFYLGDRRVTGQLGDSSAVASDTWGATMTQSRALSVNEKADLAGEDMGLPRSGIGNRLTVFEDRTALRVRKDLFFAAATDQSTKVPVTVEYNDIDLSSVAVLMAGSLFTGTALAWWVRARRR